MLRRVFVTGASGFIGGHLVDALTARDIRVRCLVRSTSPVHRLQNPLVELVECPLDDPVLLRRAVEGIDVVFHLAGLTHARRASELFDVNGKATATLADACRAVPTPPRLIHLSSLAAAGPPPHGAVVRDESHPPTPISEYGRSKRQGEIEIQKRANHLRCTVIRPGFVFGPYDQSLAMISRAIYRGNLHLVIGFRTPPLSLIYVQDLIKLLMLAAERGEHLRADPGGGYSPQGYYFACHDSEFPTYWDLGQRLGAALDRRVVVWPLWRWFGHTAAGVNVLVHRMRHRATHFNVDKVREATARSWASSSAKARTQLQFDPSDDLDAQLRATAEWYIQNGWL